MNDKNKKLWQFIFLLTVNLLMLILISTVSALRVDAVCLGSSGERVAAIQRSLKEKGFYGGKINGNYDFATRSAIKAFQRSGGIAQSGEADYETVALLGINSRSYGGDFSMEVELLARYLKRNAGTGYSDMLLEGERILQQSNGLPLSRCVFLNDKELCKDIYKSEPSSEEYSAALQVIRQHKIKKYP